MAFSVSFWNVENFHGSRSRARDVARHVESLTGDGTLPDVIGFCEVKDKTLMRDLISTHFKTHDFAMSDTATIQRRSRSSQIEILVGWRRDAFDQVMYTQRIELTGGRTTVRPGVLLNVRRGQRWYSILMLHTKSGPNTKSYRVRQQQIAQMFRLKRRLDDLERGSDAARLVVVGDLNTMGNGSRGTPRRISGPQEVAGLSRLCERHGMRMEWKEHADTFNQRKPRKLRSNLDHVLSSDAVQLRRLGQTEAGDAFTVKVQGWNQLLNDQAALHAFEDELSDHSALYFEVR